MDKHIQPALSPWISLEQIQLFAAEKWDTLRLKVMRGVSFLLMLTKKGWKDHLKRSL